jgi:ATP-dependent DNA ligase
MMMGNRPRSSWSRSSGRMCGRRRAATRSIVDHGVQRPSGFIKPCLPSKVAQPPSGPLWVHEIKHDGYRLMVRRDGERVRCFTRNGHDWADRFPAIVGAALRIKAQSFLINGEAVITSDDGVSDFCALRKADRARLTRPLTGVNLFREH